MWFRGWINNIANNKKTSLQEESFNPNAKGEVSKEAIVAYLQDVDDALIKDISVGKGSATIVYIKSLVKMEILQELVITPLNTFENQDDPEEVLKISEKLAFDELPKLIEGVMSGLCIIIFYDRKSIYTIDTFSPPVRNLTSSESESTVLGPQEAFIEALESNFSLIKKRIRNPNLKTKVLLLGTETRNSVGVLYIRGIANQENVQRVLYRLRNIEFMGFGGTAVLKQMLEDKPYSPFPQFGITQRVDAAVSALLDGRIVIFLNGSPEAAICPTSFFEMFVSPEDYYNRWTTASLLRSLRFFGFFATIMLTPLYVSVLTYHPEVLPSTLLSLLMESRTKVPFPPVIEVLIIELVIEVLREAGARMPTKIGQTIGIVGGIVIGTAAVDAGLASNILIVLVAISALLSFLPPNFLMSNGSRFIRYFFILAAALYGFLGQMIALAWLLAHLANLTSLGSPYMTPVIPRSATDLLDSVLRAPINFFIKRKGISRSKKELTRPTDEE
ncbi:spore germination protein [Alkaliphilus hydrothermalis]|uniref:Spore germination protein n=1 Tax=Alkaliphilus hydrothermalis TaxID=1482730 RepID=A0ABS2NPE5_9FIRM|nr:spore germination protein [Alkaliphilus hydrothermalis]MBM7614819.1 hypothetical protein [Alkaliphilus hydrothermalis]